MANKYSGKFRLYRLSEFRNALPGMRWFIKPLIPRYGITLLYGEPKEAGKKTFAGMAMACAVASGIDWCGFATTKGTVLYIGGEGFFGLLRRQAAWEKLHGVEADDLGLFREPINFFEPLQVKEALVALKAQGFKPDFVVVDTLARSMSGGKENATEDMTKVFELMDFFRARLVAEHVQENWSDAGILIIHHTDKRGLEYRGSSVIKGSVDALIQAKADGLEITLISKGYKDAADFKTFTVECEGVTVQTEEGPQEVLAVKGLSGVAPAAAAAEKAAKKEEEDATRAEQNYVLMIKKLREFFSNQATRGDWQKHLQQFDGVGWSKSSFERRLNVLKGR
jgi:RecA-family ATPase